jgi:hypothetical protein
MTIHSDELSPTWAVLLSLGGDAWAGLVDRSRLHVGDAAGPQREVDTTLPIGLLPCLERPYSVVLAELKDREIELGLANGSLVNLIPLRTIPDAAIETKNDYWAELALDWLEAMPQTESTRHQLMLLEESNWASQHVRHRARRIKHAQSRGT